LPVPAPPKPADRRPTETGNRLFANALSSLDKRAAAVSTIRGPDVADNSGGVRSSATRSHHDHRDALAQRLRISLSSMVMDLGTAFNQVCALDLMFSGFQADKPPDLYLMLGRAFADKQVVLALQIVGNGCPSGCPAMRTERERRCRKAKSRNIRVPPLCPPPCCRRLGNGQARADWPPPWPVPPG